jgi:DNA polymerase III subunit beta
MEFTITRESILLPLQKVCGVVERKQALPILSHVLLRVQHSMMTLVGTDMEVELSAQTPVEKQITEGETTVPGRKLLDICRMFAPQAEITFRLEQQQLKMRSGRGRYVLSTLPASDFPSTAGEKPHTECGVEGSALKRLLEQTQFAMAQQDVRFYLNGILWEFFNQSLTIVATDGHRLALSSRIIHQKIDEKKQIIVPRKTITELMRLLDNGDEQLSVHISENHIQVKSDDFQLISKLIDASFPDYRRLLPQRGDKVCLVHRESLRQTLNRVAILCHEQQQSANLIFEKHVLKMSSYNPGHDLAEEELEIDYQGGDGLSFGVNIHYILDCLAVICQDYIKITLVNNEEPLLIEGKDDEGSLYVVMPVKL